MMDTTLPHMFKIMGKNKEEITASILFPKTITPSNDLMHKAGLSTDDDDAYTTVECTGYRGNNTRVRVGSDQGARYVDTIPLFLKAPSSFSGELNKRCLVDFNSKRFHIMSFNTRTDGNTVFFKISLRDEE